MAIKTYVCFYDDKAINHYDFDDDNPYRSVDDDKPKTYFGPCAFYALNCELNVKNNTTVGDIIDELKSILSNVSYTGYKKIVKICLSYNNKDKKISYENTNTKVDLSNIKKIIASCTKY